MLYLIHIRTVMSMWGIRGRLIKRSKELVKVDKQVYLKQLIEHLQKQLEEHGDLPIYFNDDGRIGRETMLPKPYKIYTHKSYGFLTEGSLDVEDEDLYKVDLEKPIVKTIIV